VMPAIQVFAHPFSSYCWKVLIALRENDTPFELRGLGPEHPDNNAELARRWPLAKFPLLVEGEVQVMEQARSSSIWMPFIQGRCA